MPRWGHRLLGQIQLACPFPSGARDMAVGVTNSVAGAEAAPLPRRGSLHLVRNV